MTYITRPTITYIRVLSDWRQDGLPYGWVIVKERTPHVLRLNRLAAGAAPFMLVRR